MLLLDGASIESEHLLLIGDILASAVVHLFKSHIDSDRDVLCRLWLGLVQASVCSAKVTALDLKVGSRDFGEIGAEVVEGVRLQEELVKDGIAVLLVLIAASEDAVRASDAKSKAIIAIFFIDSP